MDDPINYVLKPFEGNINPKYPMGIKLYIQETNKIDEETNKLDISLKIAKKLYITFSV